MSHKLNKYTLTGIATVIAMLAVGLSSAFGSDSPRPVAPVTVPTDVVQTVVNPDGSTGTIEVKTGTPVRVPVNQAPAALQTASAKASTCGIYHNTGSQTYSAKLWFLPFGHTTQSYEWYYNCNVAWISYRNGYSGYHRCGGGWAVGVSVNVMNCTKGNDPANYPADVKPFYQFKVSALFNGFPYSFTKYMQVCLSARGGAWSCS